MDWKFKFLNAIGTGSMAMRRVLTWAEENAVKGEAMTARRAVDGLENVPGQVREDSINDTFRGIEGMSGEVDSYLVTATTDGALGGVKAVTSGEGGGASVGLGACGLGDPVLGFQDWALRLLALAFWVWGLEVRVFGPRLEV